MIIDHDPNDAPRKKSWYWDKGIYLIAWGGVAFAWGHQLYFNTPDWYQIGLGFLTGAVLATSAIEITGNKLPGSRH